MRSPLIAAYLILVTAGFGLAQKNVVFDTPRRDFVAGIGPTSLASADFNEDGKTDLLVGDQGNVISGGGASVDLLLGTGTESFQAGQSIWTGGVPQAVIAADFNGDGHKDIAIAAYGLVILLGNGDGTFRAPVTVAGVSGAVCEATGDFNHDGFVDIVVCDAGGNSVQVLFGKGDGTFQAPQTYAAGNSPNSVAVADLNRDGQADLVVSNLSSPGSISILYGQPKGLFGAPVIHPMPAYTYYAAVADVNLDGLPDIVALSETTNTPVVIVLLGSADNKFSLGSEIRPGSSALQFLIRDLNGDGIPDIALGIQGSTNVLQIYNGAGDGTFAAGQAFAVGASPWAVIAARIEKDAPLDLITVNFLGNSVSVLQRRGSGFGKLEYSLGPGASGASGIAAGDVNGDGIPDLVVCNAGSNNISVLLGTGAGTFLPAQVFSTGGGPRSIALADFNHDGYLDVATANFGDGTVSVLLGNGHGAFGAHQDIPVGIQTQSVAAKDVNNDGFPDIVVASVQSENVTTLLSNGDGTFQAPINWYINNGYAGVTAIQLADFNGDGNVDVVGEFFYGSGLALLSGNGDGSFTETSCVCGPGYPSGLAVADFNQDGKPDVTYGLFLDNLLSVSLNHNGTLAQPVSTGGLGGPTVLAAGDFNGDGLPDVVATALNSNLLSFYLGSASGTLTASSTYGVNLPSVTTYPTVAVAADLNGDGRLDLAVAQPSGVAIYLNLTK